MFHEDQAGFLAGALAGLLTETNTIAAVLGTDQVPPVVAFKEGFENGAEYTNPEVNVISTYHPGGLDVAFTDPEFGATTARQALDNGADIVFGAGGQTGNGALIEVAREGGEALCIGVDTDQWETVPEAHPCLVTSAMKLINDGVVELVDGRRRRHRSSPATSSVTSAWPTSTTSPTGCQPRCRRRWTSSPSRCCRARSRPATSRRPDHDPPYGTTGCGRLCRTPSPFRRPERAESTPMRLNQRAENIVLPIGAVVIALLIGAVLIRLNGSNPWTAYTALIDGALGSKEDVARTLARATPLMLHRPRRHRRH